MQAPAPKTYPDLINEAFIEPIRSVLIIDDEYPTWKKILDTSLDPKPWDHKGLKINKIVEAFKNEHPYLVVDIDNGEELNDKGSANLAKHLTQSDLVILDYNLDDEGAKAVSFAKKLLENDQFNLVVVHTSPDKLFESFYRILGQLLQPLESDQIEEIVEKLAERIEADQIEEFIEAFGGQEYLQIRKVGIDKALDPACDGHEILQKVYDILNSHGEEFDKEDRKNMLRRALRKLESEKGFALAKPETTSSQKRLNWSHVKPYWIRTERGFIAFADKENHDRLIDVLKEALKKWNPNPTRLFSTKLRNEIAVKGVIAEDEALSNDFVQGRFFKHLQKEFFKPSKNKNDSEYILESYMRRHFENLFEEISEGVQAFSKETLREIGEDCQIKKRYKIDGDDAEKESMLEYNAHISCIAPKAHHLTTGHIFKFENGEFWVCLSPACDLEPGQNKEGIDLEEGSELRAFMAVQLTPQDLKHRKSDFGRRVHSGNYIFSTECPKDAFCIYSDPNKFTWRMFIARNDGHLLNGLNFKILRLMEEESKQNGEESTVTPNCVDATIIARLRYEYAIKLAQKLGADMTRVGDEYVVD